MTDRQKEIMAIIDDLKTMISELLKQIDNLADRIRRISKFLKKNNHHTIL